MEPHLKTTSYIRPPLIKTDFLRSRRIFSLFHIRQTSPNRPPLSDHFRPLSYVPVALIDNDSTSLSDQLMLYFSIFDLQFLTESYLPGGVEVCRSKLISRPGRRRPQLIVPILKYRAFIFSLEAFPFKTSVCYDRRSEKS